MRLSNGVPVILQNIEGMVATIYWWVNTGSVDERPGEYGFAHFLEHMLFKDTDAKSSGRASSGQLARQIESLGGDVNAYTSFNQTVYHVTCAEQYWEKIISILGDLAQPQRFLKKDFEREREVILEEVKKNEDSPDRQIFQTLFSETFGKHPYARPVIGYTPGLKKAKLSQLEAFYRRRYTSQNMGLIVVGPLEGREKRISQLLEKNFGKAVFPQKKIGPKNKSRSRNSNLKRSLGFKARKFDVQSPSLAISFRVPELNHPDLPALDLLSGILEMGELSRLYQSLFYQSSLVTEVSGGLFVPKDPGMLYFTAELESLDRFSKVAEKMADEFVKIQNHPPIEEELQRVIVNLESEKQYSSQTVDGMASRLGYLSFVMGDLNFDQVYMEKLKRVTPNDVVEVARKYLRPEFMNIICFVAKKDSIESLKAVKDIFEKKLAPKKRPSLKKTTVEKSDFEVIQCSSGMKVAYRYRPQSPVVSVNAFADGGLRLEISNPVTSAEQDWGAGHLLAMTWTKGTSQHDNWAIARKIEGAAAHLHGASGRNTVSLSMTCLTRDWNQLSPLYLDILRDPVFPAEEVDHSRRVAMESVKSIPDHSSQVCMQLFLDSLYSGEQFQHPYGRLTLGSLESLQTIDSDRLRAFHQKWIRPQNLVLSVVGNLKRKELEDWIQKVEAQWQGNESESKMTEVASPKDLPGPRWVEKDLGREQKHILIGGLGTTVKDEDRIPLRILSALLGGQSGRLFIELREKKSMAYSVSPISFEGIERGFLGTYIASSPEKEKEAIKEIEKVYQNLGKNGPTQKELHRAVELYMGRRAMDLQSDHSLAFYYGLQTLYGIQHQRETEIRKRISAVGPQQIRKICKKYFLESYMVTSVVG